jgi:hypothetical protein
VSIPDGEHVELFPHLLVARIHHERTDDGGIFGFENGVSNLRELQHEVA